MKKSVWSVASSPHSPFFQRIFSPVLLAFPAAVGSTAAFKLLEPPPGSRGVTLPAPCLLELLCWHLGIPSSLFLFGVHLTSLPALAAGQNYRLFSC